MTQFLSMLDEKVKPITLQVKWFNKKLEKDESYQMTYIFSMPYGIERIGGYKWTCIILHEFVYTVKVHMGLDWGQVNNLGWTISTD